MEYLYIGLILFLFFLVNYYFEKFHIPSLLAYILAGLALSATISGDLYNLVETIGNIGVLLLFFLLGLHYPLAHLLNISRRIWQVGVMDIILCFGVSFIMAYLFGFGPLNALILGGVAYASSSSITLKMLEDTGRDKTPEAEFKTGLLIFEDIAAPIIVSFLVGFNLEMEISAGSLLSITARVLIIVLFSILVAVYGFRKLEYFVKRYLAKDFMLLFALAAAFLLAGLAIYLELSSLLGAFLAGVMLSETRSSGELDRFISPLKKATLPFFFFWFGASISLEAGITAPWFLLILVLWGLAAKVLVGFLGGRIYGLTWKGSLRSSFSLGQRGEFSVVIAALGGPLLIAFSGLYIILTALAGVFMFHKAPGLADRSFELLKRIFPALPPEGNNHS